MNNYDGWNPARDYGDPVTGTYADADETEDEATSRVQYAPGFSFVNVYEVDRCYGGPEEGGWWYDAGQVVLSRQVPDDQIDETVAALEDEYPRGRGRYNSGSMLYSGGDYKVLVENEPGADYPETTPHYE